MKKSLWILAVIILVIGAMMLLRGRQEPKSPMVLPASQVEEPSQSTNQPQAKLALNLEETSVINECLADHFLHQYFRSGEFDLKEFLDKESQAEWLVDQDVLHYQTQEGRFRVVSFPSQTEESKEPLRLFKVDTDGYPTPIKPPEEWSQLSDKEIFERVKNQFKILKNQKKTRILIPSSMQMELEIENDVIKTLSVNIQEKDKTRFLGCDLRNPSQKPCVCR